MRILIPIIGFGKAGGYRVLSNLASHLLSKGHYVSFLVHYRGGAIPYFPTKAKIIFYRSDGSIIRSFESARCDLYTQSYSRRRPSLLGLYYGMYAAISRLSKEFDHVIANHSLTAYPVFLACRRGLKSFYYIQAYEPEYYRLQALSISSIVLYFLSKFSYLLPLEQIANSPLYIKYKNIKAKEWVPPAIDFEIFFPAPSKTFKPDCSKVYIGIIGRPEKQKGTIYAYRAFEYLRTLYPNLVLRVAYGPIPDTLLNDQSTELCCPNSDSELADFYRSLDILIAPGIVQLGAYHYPVLEAMACGVPVVTTGYLPADSSNAWIVAPQSYNDIKDSVLEILSTDCESVKRRTSKAISDVSPLTWDESAQKLIDIMIRK